MNHSVWLQFNLLLIIAWAIPEKKNKGLRTFENSLEFFIFFTLPLEVLDKTKLHPWKFHKIVLDPLEIPRPNHQDSWKFPIIFSWSPLEIPFAISLIPPGIPYPLPLTPTSRVWFFFCNSPFEDGQLAT